jgi:poly(A) polymerase
MRINLSVALQSPEFSASQHLFLVWQWQIPDSLLALNLVPLAMMQACDETIIQQIKQVSLPKYLTARIRDIWI